MRYMKAVLKHESNIMTALKAMSKLIGHKICLNSMHLVAKWAKVTYYKVESWCMLKPTEKVSRLTCGLDTFWECVPSYIAYSKKSHSTQKFWDTLPAHWCSEKLQAIEGTMCPVPCWCQVKANRVIILPELAHSSHILVYVQFSGF